MDGHRMGRRVERIGFASERGKVIGRTPELSRAVKRLRSEELSGGSTQIAFVYGITQLGHAGTHLVN